MKVTIDPLLLLTLSNLAHPPSNSPHPLHFKTHGSHRMAELETRDKGKAAELPAELRYIQYEHALEKKYLPSIRALIAKDLSEPYSIYVYRYFLYQWGDLCFMVFHSLSLHVS